MSAVPNPLLTVEQYLEIERKAATKSEFFSGEMFAMAGARGAHNELVWNLTNLLGLQIKPPCRGYPSDMRVRITATGLYTYPDIAITCCKPAFLDKIRDTLLNPTAVFEVLSPSSEAYDRGRKFEQYSSITSFNTYVLISADRVHVDVFVRQPDSQWLLSSASGWNETVPLKSIGCELPLADLYHDVELEDAPNETHVDTLKPGDVTMSALPKTLLTAAEYLAIERKAQTKSEFLNGEMFAMAGASFEHNRLVWNIITALGRQLRPPCAGMPSDMRVLIPATGLYTYPDIVIVCGEPQFTDSEFDTLANPA